MNTRLLISFGLALLAPLGCAVTVENQPDPEPKPEPKPVVTQEPVATAEPTPEPKVCTKIGCSSSLEIALSAGKKGFARGSYLIEVEADGKKGQCETKLPLPACLKDGKVKAGLNYKCSGDLPLTMEQAPCAEPKVGPALGSLKIGDGPKDAKITVTKDKKPYGTTTVSAKYKLSRPNGPECEPVCKEGKEEACIGTCAE